MKKLLVLSLVLVMATIANAAIAGLTFQASQTEVRPSDTVTISLVTEPGTAVSAWGFDALTGLGLASGATMNNGFESKTIGAMNPTPELLSWYTYATDTETPVKYYEGVMYSFTLHIPDLPASTIITINTMFDGVDYLAPYYFTATGGMIEGNFGQVVLHVTPEPMTMGLLGLGGLFLRRRSK